MAKITKAPRSRRRILLVALLVVGILLLAVAAAVVLPILLHTSAGGSGQTLPSGYAARAEAHGADNRTRTLTVTTEDGKDADLSELREGEILRVDGAGFDPKIGIYLSICVIPEPGEKPSPCLGGVPDDAMEKHKQIEASKIPPQSSFWISDDWAWRSFATRGYDDDGAFSVKLLVPPAVQENLTAANSRRNASRGHPDILWMVWVPALVSAQGWR